MTRVLIVDDHPVFRDGLAGLLATLPEVEIVGTAGTAEEALTAVRDSACLLYTSPSPRDYAASRMPSSA